MNTSEYWTLEQLEYVADVFLETVADYPGSTPAQLAVILGLPLAHVEDACEYGARMGVLIDFEWRSGLQYYFLATTEAERDQNCRIAILCHGITGTMQRCPQS